MEAKRKKSGGGSKKHGRNRRRKLTRSAPLSRFVRGKISAKEYFRRTGQKTP